jgi:hypothetical protein
MSELQLKKRASKHISIKEEETKIGFCFEATDSEESEDDPFDPYVIKSRHEDKKSETYKKRQSVHLGQTMNALVTPQPTF